MAPWRAVSPRGYSLYRTLLGQKQQRAGETVPEAASKEHHDTTGTRQAHTRSGRPIQGELARVKRGRYQGNYKPDDIEVVEE